MDYNQDKILEKLDILASTAEAETKLLFKKLKKKKPKNLDDIVHSIHNETWENVDCLECANCCKSLGPRITDNDIEKLSRFLKEKPSQVISNYLRIDEDGDYVFKNMPCPFLLPDNYCLVYEARPKACREYPHTDRKRFYQVLTETAKNTFTCPAVYHVVEELKKQYK